MVQTATVIMERKETKVLKNKAKGTEFTKRIIIDANGIEYDEKDLQIPLGKPVLIAYETTINKSGDREYENRFIKKFHLVEESKTPSTPPKKPEGLLATSSTKVPWESTAKVPLHTQHIPVTNRDISMEVSGLLQSLISTGHFTLGVGESEIALENLESALRDALKLKHNVVSDLQAGTF
jgi:hypothetical protein